MLLSVICGDCTMGYYRGPYQLGHEEWCPTLRNHVEPAKQKPPHGSKARVLLHHGKHELSD